MLNKNRTEQIERKTKDFMHIERKSKDMFLVFLSMCTGHDQMRDPPKKQFW
jgi:hypothetical protein